MQIEELAGHQAVRRAREEIRLGDGETVRQQLRIVAIPAPTHAEAERGEYLAARFRDAGLREVRVDEVGNVLAAVATGNGGAELPPLVVAAHLDTVFPAGTELKHREAGDRIHAPGITDNARGLAVLVTLARLLGRGDLPIGRPVYLVATVGEEGAGDLRGVKHLFREGSPLRDAHAFISLDGSGLRRIVNRATGSRRLRVTLDGPGGHSWSDWGRPNPIHALGAAVEQIAAIEVPAQPRSTLTVARIGGGTSINAIPSQAWAEIDIRSEGAGALTRLEREVRQVLERSAPDGNHAGTLRLEVSIIGDRPSAEAPLHSRLVGLAVDATRMFGVEPELVASSTDANIPLALGIPAVTIGCGGESGGIHTLDEWYANVQGAEGVERALMIILGSANGS